MNNRSFGYDNFSNLQFIENLYQEFLKSPTSVEPSWRYFFQGMEIASSLQKFPVRENSVVKEPSVQKLIETYRNYGHLKANTNPLEDPKPCSLFDLSSCGFTTEDLDKVFDDPFLQKAELQKIIERYENIYCRSIGLEIDHCDPAQKLFFQNAFEKEGAFTFTKQMKQSLLMLLNQAEGFESFIHLKHPGQKRFSLEGGESLIVGLHACLESLSHQGVEETVIAMAHRGRLNVLTTIMGKSYAEVFEEFSAGYIPSSNEGSGDVKYHKGYQSLFANQMRLELCPNPSHLESVDPVLQGYVKSKQVKIGSEKKVCSLMIHGDASLSGQGVVYEVLQMSKIEGYSTGGTLHFVVNNQIGYTALPSEGRSTYYCTDIAKAFKIPVIHVSGDDPEACYFAGKLAAVFRQEFGQDIFIDLICYRKYGHSEADEPLFTQPLLYEKIRKKQNVRNLYKKALMDSGEISDEFAAKIESDFLDRLEKELKNSEVPSSKEVSVKQSLKKQIITAVDPSQVESLTKKFSSLPEGFSIHPKLKRLFEERAAVIEAKEGIDWGMAEYLAYASLLSEQIPVRLSGQDCRRGTFSHRHAAIIDQKNEMRYFPLNHLQDNQALFTAYNSLLSEYAVLGFEYGYASGTKPGLTIWEAQFGDFANGAQIIIDQFISSGEQKWNLRSPVVMMLPHGYEGQGPEHSSARVERYLQLCAQNNMKVALPSKPSQVFHLLREQALDETSSPLILFTPKALLRYGPSLSRLEEFTSSSFQKVIDDPGEKKGQKLLICSGKIYYDLIEERKKRSRDDLAIIRVELLYPFPKEELKALILSYPNLHSCAFVQEEPKNMGAYQYASSQIREILPDKVEFCYVGRAESASVAAGSMGLHQKEKQKLLEEAFL